MASKMIDHLNSLENVTVMLETTGTGLITNQENEVIGATAEGKDGSMVIYADNVVLATSGFAANKEMLEKYIPRDRGCLSHGRSWRYGRRYSLGHGAGRCG